MVEKVLKKVGAKSETAPVKGSSTPPQKPKYSDIVEVKNPTHRAVHAPSGSVGPGEVGKMTRLDAERLQRYVEIVNG